MRTTLKRGIGQAAGLNGNGHSAVPPVFGPITRYGQPERRRRSLIGTILRGFGWLVLALVVVSAGIGGGLYLYGHESIAAVVDKTAQIKHASKALAYAQPGKPAIALVAG